MLRDHATRGAALLNDEQPTCRRSNPSALGGEQLRHQPILAIQGADQLLDIQEDGRLIDPTCSLEVKLPPSPAYPRAPNEPTDSAIIHAHMIRTTAYQPLTDD